ncbi:ABC transporter substrate-binding protein [Streptomyces sp. NBC_01092]|uniref:ABC transporter substrate-binding protein n=1 Tax=Streptomyces sp. NBC_01092 TaxID=2903748 RepID=UPI00386BC949|nr:ABC transporter substrate-binding protein [Streptomyces sp. NBC_01092]
MNRKVLALTAVVGVLIAVLTVYYRYSPLHPHRDFIVAGTTDRLTTSRDVSAPVDPAYAYDVGAWNLLRQTVQTLMVHRGNGEPEPEAAQNCGFTDTGSERYACVLRKGLKFSDGTPLTAADVKFSIDRARTIKANSGASALLSSIDMVETLGVDKVVFHLKTADATFPFKLSTPVAGIVSSKNYAEGKLRKGFAIDGSGPYAMRAYVKDNTLVKATFTKNPNYHGLLTPKTDTVVLKYFKNAAEMGDSLEKGGIDVMTRTMSPDQIRKFKDDGDGSAKLVEMLGLEIRFLGFNTNAASVKSKAVRQAIAQAIDRSELVSTVYGTEAQPLYSLVPATIVGHTNAFFNKYGEPSVAKARTILANGGITTPVKLTLHYASDRYGPTSKKEFEVLKNQLNSSRLFNVSIEDTPWSQFRIAKQKGGFDVYGMGWFPDYPDAENFLAPFLDTNNVLNSPYNNSVIRDTLIPESRRTPDRIAASKTLERIQEIAAADVPILPLWQGKQYLAATDSTARSQFATNSSSTLQLWELELTGLR